MGFPLNSEVCLLDWVFASLDTSFDSPRDDNMWSVGRKIYAMEKGISKKDSRIDYSVLSNLSFT